MLTGGNEMDRSGLLWGVVVGIHGVKARIGIKLETN